MAQDGGRQDAAKPLRILLYSAAPKADRGGLQNLVLGLAGHLRAAGHRVVTAWPDGEEGPSEWRLALTADANRSGRPKIAALASAGLGAAGLAARLARFRPDLVHVHFPQGQALYFSALRALLGYRLVLTFHGSDLHQASPALAKALPRLTSSADGVTAVSRELADTLKARTGAPDLPVRVIGNGIDTAFWTRKQKEPSEPLAVAAGRLTPVKGFDTLLDAFADGAPEAARLIIAGEGEELQALKERAAELGVADRVQFPGRLERAELRALYRKARLFVLSSRREGMPLALIEAMACGLPAVATKVGGVGEVMDRNCGELVLSEDVPAMSAALHRWLEEREAAAEAGEAAAERAQRFSDQACYQGYEALYREVSRA